MHAVGGQRLPAHGGGAGAVDRRTRPARGNCADTWYFDKFIDGEWEAFGQAISAGQPPWLRYLLADTADDTFPPYLRQHGVPGQAPLVNFPEISMTWMHPWGGYGAAPLPMRQQKMWESIGDLSLRRLSLLGRHYEDINKVIWLQY